MKKGLIIFLATFYLCFSSGVLVSAHFCGKKWESISFANSTKEDCCGSKKKSKGCCHTVKFFLKVKDSQEAKSVIRLCNPLNKTTKINNNAPVSNVSASLTKDESPFIYEILDPKIISHSKFFIEFHRLLI
jgi:hypothetical protein